MRVPDERKLASRITQSFGVQVAVSTRPVASGKVVIIKPVALHKNEGFSIEARLGWRTIEAIFRPGRFAGGFLTTLGEAPIEHRRTAAVFLKSLIALGGKLAFTVNGTSVDPTQPDEWPTEPWRSVEIAARRTGIVIEQLSEAEITSEIMRWGGGVFGTVVSLAGVEEEVYPDLRVPEGALTTITVNRYERSRVNRSACIAALGDTCLACGFDFGATYGDTAMGHIEVHHVRPLSELGAGYLVDPTTDLVPVCSNCHAFMHLRRPPYSVEEVRQSLRQSRATADTERTPDKAGGPGAIS